MKIRSGFVSNSSSSSFILSYNKNKVLTDPKDIVEYIKNFPDGDIILNGGECNEGDDIFRLDDELKSLIKKFPMEFIKTNTGTKINIDYEYDAEDNENHFHEIEKEIPKITAYIGKLALVPCDSEYCNFNIDMSDVENAEVNPLDWSKKDTDPEIKRKFEISDNWYTVREEREIKLRKEYENKMKDDYRAEVAKAENVPESEISSEIVYISNRSCNPDYSFPEDFAERYLTEEYFDESNNQSFYHISKRDRKKACPFSVFYDETITDKNEIVDYICNRLDSSIVKSYLLWNNPVYNSMYDFEDKMFDFYEIGDKEAKIFKDNKESFLNNDREAVLFTNSEVMVENGVLSNNHGNNFSMDYGKVIVIPSGDDVKDFEKNVSEGER